LRDLEVAALVSVFGLEHGRRTDVADAPRAVAIEALNNQDGLPLDLIKLGR